MRASRTRFLLLHLVGIAVGSGGGAHAVDASSAFQSADTIVRAPARDICDLAGRLGSERAGADCLRRRTSLLPGLDDVGPDRLDAWTVAPLPTTIRGGWRGAYPIDRNDGALWAGRGTSASLTAGIATRLGPVTLAVSPVVTFARNRSFPIPDARAPEGPWGAYPWAEAGLDWPLRPGGGSVQTLGAGDSWIEADLDVVRVGVSTERLWWGPARRYPLLFSGTGPGFAHAYATLASPLQTVIGDLRGELLWGRVTESKYFDARPDNDHRLLGAFRVIWSYPAVVPGLELAWSVVRHEPLDGSELGVSRLPQLFLGDPGSEDPSRRGLSMGTFAFRWGFPDEGAEVYGEIGRGSGFVNPVPGVSDTRLALVYMLGLSKASLDENGSGWRFAGELIRQSMELPQPTGTPERYDWGLRPGHTHRGALLGAYIGPGSNAQYIVVDRLDPARPFGFFAERVRRDDDTYWRVHAPSYGFRGHDVEWTLGARAGGWLDAPFLERITGPVAVSLEAGISRRKNRNFVRLDGGRTWEFLREWNPWAEFAATIDLSWRGAS